MGICAANHESPYEHPSMAQLKPKKKNGGKGEPVAFGSMRDMKDHNVDDDHNHEHSNDADDTGIKANKEIRRKNSVENNGQGEEKAGKAPAGEGAEPKAAKSEAEANDKVEAKKADNEANQDKAEANQEDKARADSTVATAAGTEAPVGNETGPEDENKIEAEAVEEGEKQTGGAEAVARRFSYALDGKKIKERRSSLKTVTSRHLQKKPEPKQVNPFPIKLKHVRRSSGEKANSMDQDILAEIRDKGEVSTKHHSEVKALLCRSLPEGLSGDIHHLGEKSSRRNSEITEAMHSKTIPVGLGADIKKVAVNMQNSRSPVKNRALPIDLQSAILEAAEQHMKNRPKLKALPLNLRMEIEKYNRKNLLKSNRWNEFCFTFEEKPFGVQLQGWSYGDGTPLAWYVVGISNEALEGLLVPGSTTLVEIGGQAPPKTFDELAKLLKEAQVPITFKFKLDDEGHYFERPKEDKANATAQKVAKRRISVPMIKRRGSASAKTTPIKSKHKKKPSSAKRRKSIATSKPAQHGEVISKFDQKIIDKLKKLKAWPEIKTQKVRDHNSKNLPHFCSQMKILMAAFTRAESMLVKDKVTQVQLQWAEEKVKEIGAWGNRKNREPVNTADDLRGFREEMDVLIFVMLVCEMNNNRYYAQDLQRMQRRVCQVAHSWIMNDNKRTLRLPEEKNNDLKKEYLAMIVENGYGLYQWKSCFDYSSILRSHAGGSTEYKELAKVLIKVVDMAKCAPAKAAHYNDAMFLAYWHLIYLKQEEGSVVVNIKEQMRRHIEKNPKILDALAQNYKDDFEKLSPLVKPILSTARDAGAFTMYPMPEPLGIDKWPKVKE
mmetsp:Transcript_16165/g.29064  ORF Transcript_16165/g.29064 Transcript_16165/m.29064 type:complete len:833 (-) Transcript_16165:208-2706(-)